MGQFIAFAVGATLGFVIIKTYDLIKKVSKLHGAY